MTLSQLPSYDTPGSCSIRVKTSPALRKTNSLDSEATETIASALSGQLEPMSTAGTYGVSNPIVTTPRIIPTAKQFGGQLSEVERILENMGHPRSLVEILMNRRAVTREDLLSLLREEVRVIRSKLGLGIWEGDQETNTQLGVDETLTTTTAEPQGEYSRNDSNIKKLKLAETGPLDDCKKAGHTPRSDCHQPERHSTLGTSPVASNRISRGRPAALDLRKTLML